MKKPIAIGIALIILTMIIGIERIERGFHFLISDNRTERARVYEMTLGDSRVTGHLKVHHVRSLQSAPLRRWG
jgi:hypothetical protein